MFALKEVRIERDADGIPISTLREIGLLKQMKHSNIVNVFDVAAGPKLETVHMLMEYCEQVSSSFVFFSYSPLQGFGNTAGYGAHAVYISRR